MGFKDTYTSESEKTKIENKDKKVISDDAYAIGDVIDDLIKKIEHARVSWLR